MKNYLFYFTLLSSMTFSHLSFSNDQVPSGDGPNSNLIQDLRAIDKPFSSYLNAFEEKFKVTCEVLHSETSIKEVATEKDTDPEFYFSTDFACRQGDVIMHYIHVKGPIFSKTKYHVNTINSYPSENF